MLTDPSTVARFGMSMASRLPLLRDRDIAADAHQRAQVEGDDAVVGDDDRRPRKSARRGRW